MNDTCPIWGSEFPAETQRSSRVLDFATLVSDSPRAGGSFKIEDTVRDKLGMDEHEKARLTTWILNQNAKGAWLPEITREIVDYAKGVPPLPTYERANRLLRLIASRVNTVGYKLEVPIADPQALAWSESVVPAEVDYFLRYLADQGWLKGDRATYSGGISHGVSVTVGGYRQIETQEANVLSSQGFVAMWFDDSMKQMRANGIVLGIKDAGYEPYLVDEDKLTDKIDDKIISEIRRSRFLVADFTHDRKGARGGVYFEAGFALGLGIPVIFCCREDQIDDVHFDTRQYNHILWTTPEELKTKLADRIGARLGPGPGTLVNS